MARIHPTAIVEAGAELADDVDIGPYAIVGSRVRLGAGATLKSHAVVVGRTTLGPGTVVFPFASVGHPPQDMKYAGEESELVIGARTVIREHVTINPGTKGGGMVTRIGDDCLLMAGAHVAHDCNFGNHVILVNGATVGGHVEVQDYAILGGLSAVHQFVRVGKHAMIGGMTGVDRDIIPYGTVTGNRAHLAGLNLVGLKRRGFDRDDIHALRNAYRLLFAQEGTLQERVADVAAQFANSPPVMDIVRFIGVDSSRPVCQPRDDNSGD